MKESTTDLSFNKLFLKAKYSFYSAIVFFIFINPETHMILQRIFHNITSIITPSGALTLHGIFINTFLFFITILSLMLLPIY
jgi:hypothetical protein